MLTIYTPYIRYDSISDALKNTAKLVKELRSAFTSKPDFGSN